MGTPRLAGLVVVVALAAVGMVAIASTADPPASLPPVIVKSPNPLTPLSTAGSGLGPTVAVKVHVAPTGVVREVEVVSVSPSSRFDADFATAAREALSKWRFAPALEDGRQVESTLEWSLEFRPLEERQAATSGFLVPQLDDLVDREQPEVEHLLAIYTLPVEQQREHLRRLFARAEAELSKDAHQQAVSPLFVVTTDQPGNGVAAAVLGNLGVTYRVTSKLLHGEIPLARPEFPIQVVMYASRDEYRRYVAAVDGIEETSGMFSPPGLLAFHTELGSQQEVLALMIHEAVHAFVYGFVVRPGHDLPRWLGEGFATYMGNSRIHKGALEPGARTRTQFFTAPMRFWRGKTLAQLDADGVRQRIRKGTALTVSEILAAGPDTFYGEDMPLYYAQAWILVHFLRHGAPGWSDAEFPRFLLYVAEGYDAADALNTVYGLPTAELEARYRDHAMAF